MKPTLLAPPSRYLIGQPACHFLDLFPPCDGLPAPRRIEKKQCDFRVLPDALGTIQLPKEKIVDWRF